MDLLKKMLEKNPKQRITIKGSLNHPWMTSFQKKPELSEDFEDDQSFDWMGNLAQPFSPCQINSVQQNMKNFYQDRFNVETIKPSMELVLNIPLITGRIAGEQQTEILSPLGQPTPQTDLLNNLDEKRHFLKNMAQANNQYQQFFEKQGDQPLQLQKIADVIGNDVDLKNQSQHGNVRNKLKHFQGLVGTSCLKQMEQKQQKSLKEKEENAKQEETNLIRGKLQELSK